MTETADNNRPEGLLLPTRAAPPVPSPSGPLEAPSPGHVPEQRAPAHFVVGVQGDDSSLTALRWAARSAGPRGADIEALMAWDLPEPPKHLPGGLEEAALDVIGDLGWALESIVRRSGISALPGIRVSTTVVAAPAKVALAEAVRRANVIVLGAAHHSAALAALAVARQTAATAQCPVVLVPPAIASSWEAHGDRFVVGMDGSPQSIAALKWAFDEADRRLMPLCVVTVGLAEDARASAATFVASEGRSHPGVETSLLSLSGDPGEVLAQQSRGAEALVLGQHGKGAIARRLPALGSVSRWCAAHPISPVVVVPWRRTRRPS